MIKIAVAWFFFVSQVCFAGLPPTTAKGLSETSPSTTFFFQTPYNQFTTTSGATRLIETGNENYLLNPSFEAATLTGWTNGAFTYTRNTSGAYVYSGAASASFTVNAASSIIVSQSVTPPVAELSRNFVASVAIATGNSAIVGVTVCALVNAVEQTCVAAKETGLSSFQIVQVPFTVNSINGTSMGIEVKSTSATGRSIYVDAAYVGALSLGSSTVDTGFVNYGANTITATITNPTKGTVAIDQFVARRSGSNLLVQLAYRQTAAGTIGSGDYLFPIPSATGCSIDSTVTPYNTGAFSTITASVGGGQVSSASASGYGVSVVPYDSTHVRVFVNSTTATNTYQAIGSTSGWWDLSQATINYGLYFSVPCAGWTTLNAISPGNADYGPVAYTPTFSASMGTVTAINCLQQRSGANLIEDCAFTTGTVTAATATLSLPTGVAISSSASSTAVYGTCSIGASGTIPIISVLGAASGTTVSFAYRDGTTSGLASANASAAFPSTTAVSCHFQLPVQGWAPSGGAPQLVGSVVNPGNGVLEHFSVQFASGSTITSGPCNVTGACTVFNSSIPGVVVNRAGGGNYNIVVPAGTCSQPLSCVWMPALNSQLMICNANLTTSTVTAPTTTTAYAYCANIGASPAAQDVAGQITCDCQH